MNSISSGVGLAVIVGFFIGCGEQSSTKVPEIRQSREGPQTSDDLATSNYEQIAHQLDEHLHAGDATLANSLVDWDDFYRRVFRGMSLSKKDLEDTMLGIQISFERNSWNHKTVARLREGGTYTFLRVHDFNGQKRALFRSVQRSGGIDYHDHLLTKNDSGIARICDIFTYSTGEFMSEGLRRALQQSDSTEFDNSSDKLSRIIELLRQDNPVGALILYNDLPPKLQQEKSILRLGLRAAAESHNDNEYQDLLYKFRKSYPNDPSINFMSIDYFALRNDYEKVLDAINALPKTIANDPFLDVLRAEMFFKARKFNEAKSAAEAAAEAEPSLIDAYWIQVTISLEQHQFGETLKQLKIIDQMSDVSWDTTLSTPQYSRFRDSPEYLDWLKYLEGDNPH